MSKKVKVTFLKGDTGATISRRKMNIGLYEVAFGDQSRLGGIDEFNPCVQVVDAVDCRHLSRYFDNLARKLDEANSPVLTEA